MSTSEAPRRTSNRRLVAGNTAVQVAGKAAMMVMGAVSIAVITRYLGTAGYGRYALAITYMQLFGVLADVGLFATVVREISKRPDRTETLVGNALMLRGLLSLAAFGLGAGISFLLPYEPDVRLAIVAAAAPLTLGLLNTSIVAVFQARLVMSRAVASDVLGRAVALGAVVAVAALDLGFYAVIGAAAVGMFASLVVTYALSRSIVSIRPLADVAVWRALLTAGVPLGIALAINQLYFRADTLIISLFLPVSEVGLYSLAYRILELTVALGTVFLATTFPLISRYVQDSDPRLNGAIQSSWNLFVVIGVPLAAGGAILAPGVVELTAGEHFADAAQPLAILFTAGALGWVNGIFGYALIAKERQMSALWLNVTGLVINVALNLALVPVFGIVAAATVTVGCELLILAGSVYLMRRNFSFFPSPGPLPAALGGTAAMAAVLLPLRGGSTLVLATLGAAVYLGILFAVSPTSRQLAAGLRT